MSFHKDTHGLVLCEDKGDVAVMEKIARSAKLRKLRFKYYSGKTNLHPSLEVLSKTPAFNNGSLRRILITRDADDSYQQAWDEVRETLQLIFGSCPDEPEQWHHSKKNDLPAIAVWIAPTKGQAGMIESLCLEAASKVDSTSLHCLNMYTRCLQQNNRIQLHEKERFGIWTIAAQGASPRSRRMSFRDAIERLPIPWNDKVFATLRSILAETANMSPG
jgi:hypothetical protein